MSPFGMFAPKTGHPALFNELCKLHEIDKKTRPVLDAMVQCFGLPQPSLLFIDPKYFLEAANTESLAEHLPVIRELCYKWFGKRM